MLELFVEDREISQVSSTYTYKVIIKTIALSDTQPGNGKELNKSHVFLVPAVSLGSYLFLGENSKL
jgi:hypothetical protein